MSAVCVRACMCVCVCVGGGGGGGTREISAYISQNFPSKHFILR